MLVLTRRIGETIVIAGNIRVMVVAIKGGKVPLGITAPAGIQADCLRSIGPRDLDCLHKEIAKAKKRFGLPDDAPVFTCYEAGRDGFWLHRYLTAQGVHNSVVDSASMQVIVVSCPADIPSNVPIAEKVTE